MPLVLFNLAVLPLVTACYEPEGTFTSSGYFGPQNICEHNGECPEESVCAIEIGHCVVETYPDPKTYFVKATPRATTEVPPQVFEVSLPSMGIKELTLHQTMQAPLVTTALNSDETLENLTFFVEITRDDLPNHEVDIPGASPNVSTHMIPWNDETTFYVELLPGQEWEYTIKLTPKNNASSHFPPAYFDAIRLNTDGEFIDSAQDVVNSFEAHESEVKVKGTIKLGGEVVDGLTIVLNDPDTGRQLSTTDTTGNQGSSEPNGEFSVWIAPGVTSFTLVASRPTVSWYPKFEKTFLDMSGELTEIDLSDIVLSETPLPGPVLYSASVEKTVEWEGQGDVSFGVKDCLVIFESYDVFGGHAVKNSYTNAAGVVTGESGVEWIYLYPAEYSVTVIPPAHDEFYLNDSDVFYSQYDLQISGDSTGQLFQLSIRSLFQGQLITADTEAEVPEGILRVEPLIDSPPFARTSVTAVESDGTYAVWVDKGESYRFTMEAPPESGYAWRSFTEESNGDQDRTVVLPIPFANEIQLNLAGESSQASAIALKGAVLEFYEEISGTIILVGRAVADEDGHVNVLLEP